MSQPKVYTKTPGVSSWVPESLVVRCAPLLLGCVFCLSLLLSWTGTHVPRIPICIVGAGPGGLTIASELQSRGYDTVIFDKQEEVGGKCQQYHHATDNTDHPLGALLFTNHTYVNTLPLIKAANVTLQPGISMAAGWKYWLYGAGPEASTVTTMPNIDATQIALLSAEFERYTTEWMHEFAPLYTSLRYPYGIPKEYTVPISQWLASRKYVALPDIMAQGMVPYGYGHIDETPAIYMLQYFTPEIIGAFLGLKVNYIVDYHRVFVHFSRSLAGTLHLNTTVIKIDRGSHRPIITYTSSGATGIQSCSDVVLAFAPTLENLHPIDMTMSRDENDVFSRVNVTSYWSSATLTKITYPSLYQQVPPRPLGEPVGFLRVSNNSNITTTYSWGAKGSSLTTADVTQLLANALTLIQAGQGIRNPEVALSDVKAIRKWDYFPHFNTADLADGIYARYNALQGKQHTYYSSGLNGFETVEFAIRAGKDLVQSFF